MMKNLKKILISSLAILAATTVYASTPGTQQDPLVSRSYLEQRLNQLTGTELSDEVLENIIETVIANVMFQLQNTPSVTQNPLTTEALQFGPVFLEAGTVLIGDTGTELIIRGGVVQAYVYGADGIVNLTRGTEHFADDLLAHNELLLIPRRDARGIRVLSDSWVMIRGGYSIR
ncbi:MAG: hypothetical protein FWE02_00350 [Defluviitaleaceae bacterium]|nr:hypothetical protein [Defluviitaleaceae bacterium]